MKINLFYVLCHIPETAVSNVHLVQIFNHSAGLPIIVGST